jgi:membrane protease YdiL (CAAX protease family)
MSKGKWIFAGVIEFFLVVLLFFLPAKEGVTLLLVYNLQFVVIQKAFLIRNKWFNGADWLRRSVYFVPYLLVLLFFTPPVLTNRHVFLLLLVGILVGGCFMIPRVKELRPYFNRELLSLFPPIKVRSFLLEAYSLVGSAFIQELFHKSFVIAVLFPVLGMIPALVISGLLFVGEHVLHTHAQNIFKPLDYLAQFLLSVCAGGLYLYSGSVWVAVSVHLTYNLLIAYSHFYRFWVTQPKRGRTLT